MRVNPATLKAQATAMTAQLWMKPSTEAIPPDALPLAKDAVDNLNESARMLADYQAWAEAENHTIAEMLTNAAKAYEEIDYEYAGKLDDPGRQAKIDAITLPAPTIEMPPLPDAASTPSALGGSGYSDVKKTEGDLNAGDHGASLQSAQTEWAMASGFVESHAMMENVTDWEGEAADSAFNRMNAFSEWLHQLSAAWNRLASSAAKVRGSHVNAKFEHVPIYTRYVALESQLGVGNSVNVNAIVKELEDLQRQSDEVREEYAKNATVDPVRMEDPPSVNRGPTRLTTPGGSGGGGGAGGEQPSGDPTAMAQKMGQSLGQPQSAAGSPSSAAGSPSDGGAASGGGSPSGGGTPSGGGAPGGVPGGGPSTGTPKLPTDPSLRPAATSGGGGSGAGGGGSGGGVPSSPLSPAVTAETVAPAPPTPAVAGVAPGPTNTGAMAGAGMGGMAPMHGAGAQQGQEKRRDPRLAPDEDLYTEDRPWTEAVIGDRRRREVKDVKEST